MIFGSLIGARVGPMQGFDYKQYIAPGLIMMPVITRFLRQRRVVVLRRQVRQAHRGTAGLALPNWIIVAGYTAGGVLRGFMVGIVVTLVSLVFARLPVAHIGALLAAALLSSIVFSLAGFINAIFARNFDQVNWIPTFILTPLNYFGGVFYSVSMLPVWAQKVSLANPILHMVNAFRYGFLGTSDVHVKFAFVLMLGLSVLLFGWRYAARSRVGIRD